MDITVSVISHRHGDEVRELLARLAALGAGRPRRVIVTFNVPEPAIRAEIDGASWPFALALVDNAQPAGFGANHNSAFRLDREQGPSALFAVLNPDVHWQGDPFAAMQPLLAAAPRVGLVYPIQFGADGGRQDQERLVPTLARLWARHRPGGRAQELPAGAAPDWVNAAFVLLRREAFASVGGFNEGYHMYCEDVDLCLRLQLAGWRMQAVPQVKVVHEGQRGSHRKLQHTLWHLKSLWQLWQSKAYADFRRKSKHKSRRRAQG